MVSVQNNNILVSRYDTIPTAHKRKKKIKCYPKWANKWSWEHVSTTTYLYTCMVSCRVWWQKSCVNPYSLCQVRGLINLPHTFQGLHYLLPSGLVSLFKPSIGYRCLLLPQVILILFHNYLASVVFPHEALAESHCFIDLWELHYQLISTGDDWRGEIRALDSCEVKDSGITHMTRNNSIILWCYILKYMHAEYNATTRHKNVWGLGQLL